MEKKRQDQQAFEPCNTEICPNMSMTVEGLDEAWMYEFRIKCANLIGESEPSIPLMVVIQDDEGKPECKEQETNKLLCFLTEFKKCTICANLCSDWSFCALVPLSGP